MRMKSKWYKKDKPRSLEENAHALGFICWQIAVDRVKNMERWQYTVDLPDRTLSVIAEYLIFLAHLADRLCYENFNQQERAIFLNALVKRFADILDENRADVKDDSHSREDFIQLVNQNFNEYSAFCFNPQHASLDIYRYLGHRISEVLGAEHNKGVVEQVIEIEGPESFYHLKKAMTNLIGLNA